MATDVPDEGVSMLVAPSTTSEMEIEMAVQRQRAWRGIAPMWLSCR